MVNSEEFTKRLNKIMDYYDLSAASFADKVDVGRSSISHLLSGRNKPSLDFVMKIIAAFPEVELYWLLNGKGSFPKLEKPAPTPQRHPENKISPALARDLFSEEEKREVSPQVQNVPPDENKKIQRIVIFYNDGTFDAYDKNQ